MEVSAPLSPESLTAVEILESISETHRDQALEMLRTFAYELRSEQKWEDLFSKHPGPMKKMAKQADAKFELWRENPFHPSLRFKCVNSEDNIWSVRVNMDYRALAVKEKDIAIRYQTVSAFANTHGGTLLIGVTDRSEVCGIDIGKETLQDWLNRIKLSTQPSLFPDIEEVDLNGMVVVRIIVPVHPIKPVR